MGAEVVIDSFVGQHAFLSNFYAHSVNYEGRLYPTNEHAFAAAKTMQPHLRAEIAAASTASQAKALGRKVKLISGWDQCRRYTAMESLIALKFSPDSSLATQILDTGGELLVEGNTWHDQVWGDCRCGRKACEPVGMNLLGWMLVRRRSGLRVLMETYV